MSIWGLRKCPLLRGSMSFIQGVFVTQRTLCTICPSEVRRTGEYSGPTKVSFNERVHVLYSGSLCHTFHCTDYIIYLVILT